jgi:hypothetical protein
VNRPLTGHLDIKEDGGVVAFTLWIDPDAPMVIEPGRYALIPVDEYYKMIEKLEKNK